MLSKADTHVHTFYSGTTNYKVLRFPESTTSPEEQVDTARKNGMSVVCITDHNQVSGAFRAQKYAKQFDDIDVVIGDEIMTSDGEVIGLWLNDFIKPGLTAEETIDEIRSQGGVTIAPHPFSFYVKCLKHKIFDLDLDGIETINGGHVDKWTNSTALSVWRNNPGKWAQIGSSDSHSPITAGYTWTDYAGCGEDDLRKAILAKNTVACGYPAPAFSQTQWSLQIVTQAQKMMIQSMFGRLKGDPENPLVAKAQNTPMVKKMVAIIGGAIYCCPPTPFLATWIATNWLKKQAEDLKAHLRKTYNY